MATNTNRFALLDVDSSDEEREPVVEQPPVVVPLPVAPTSSRNWNLDESRPTEIREWNLEKTSSRRRGPFSRYAFRDEERPKVAAPRGYGFRDESPPREAKKPNSPSSPVSPHPLPPLPPSPPLPTNTLSEFPKLSEYNRPCTPPYPPDDGWYPTLAERVKLAMERQEIQAKTETKVIGMDTVIPMPVRLNKNLSIE